MKVTELSKKALRFEGSLKDIPIVSESGVLFRFVEIDEWLRVMMEISDDTTSDDLRRAIPLALNLRDRLQKWQGPWSKGGKTEFLEKLHRMHRDRGYSYKQIAEQINQQIVDLLFEHQKFLSEVNEVSDQINNLLDFFLWEFESNQFSYAHARGILISLSLNPEEIDELLQAGLENIQLDISPFEKGYPVSREKIISVLRTWRSGKQHELLNERED